MPKDYTCLTDNRQFNFGKKVDEHHEKYPKHIIVTSNRAKPIKKALDIKPSNKVMKL